MGYRNVIQITTFKSQYLAYLSRTEIKLYGTPFQNSNCNLNHRGSIFKREKQTESFTSENSKLNLKLSIKIQEKTEDQARKKRKKTRTRSKEGTKGKRKKWHREQK